MILGSDKFSMPVLEKTSEDEAEMCRKEQKYAM